MAAPKIIIRDMRLADAFAEPKKATTRTSVFFVTVVYHRVVRRLTEAGWEYVPDFDEYKDYFDGKIHEFFSGRFGETLETKYADLQQTKPEVSVDITPEINAQGWLHHHAIVELTYPRIVDPLDPQGRLENWQINWTDLQRVSREVIVPGKEVTIKAQVENIKTNSLDNLKKYILKRG